MKWILRIFGTGIIIWATAAGCGKEPAPVDGRAAAVDSVFAEWDSKDSPGCALAIIENGTIVYERGYGMADLEHGVPITGETVFYAGSVSKQFVAASMAILAREGGVSLDDDIRKYIPEFPDYGAPIRIRNLIHHTSGIRDDLELWELTGRSYLDYMDVGGVLDLICRQKELNFQPGERYMYSNSCYFLMSVIIERVTGKSLREYASEKIFQPLGMATSHFHDDYRHIVPNRAFGYTKREDGSFGTLIMRFDLVGSGGLYTNVRDFARWDANFYENRLGGGQALIDTLLTRGRLNDGTVLDYAFALVPGTYRGTDIIEHAGALGGYRAHYLRFPGERVSFIILGNLDSLGPGPLARKAADAWLGNRLSPADTLAAETAQSSSPDTGNDTPPHVAPDPSLAGTYYCPELDTTWQLEVRDGALRAQAGYTVDAVLDRTGADTYKGGAFTFTFSRNASGRVTGLRLDTARVKHLWFERR